MTENRPCGDILETLTIASAGQRAQVIEIPIRRGDRAVEGARLEIVCTPNKGTEGSNPSLSASKERCLILIRRGLLVLDSLSSGCRLLIVRSCARRHRETRQVREEAAVTDRPLCHGAT
jgi:hypothetical protein